MEKKNNKNKEYLKFSNHFYGFDTMNEEENFEKTTRFKGRNHN